MTVLRLRRTVVDLPRAIEFYQGALGFASTDRDTHGARLRLGEQEIELVLHGGPAPLAAGAVAPDPRFQHAAIATFDIEAAWRRVEAHGAVAISRGGPQRLPADTGGVTAFKFRDPDGHPLELIHFPAGVGDPRWQRPSADGPTLGIDHFAVVVASVDASAAWFAQRLGFHVVSRGVNRGDAQDRLDGLERVEVDVVALAPRQGAGTPHLELLRYRHPAAKTVALAASVDRSSRDVIVCAGSLPAAAAPQRSEDPDGHAFLLQAEATRRQGDPGPLPPRGRAGHPAPTGPHRREPSKAAEADPRLHPHPTPMTSDPRPARIEEHAVIGNCESIALVSRQGAVDWLCLPRFDSAACCAALLGDADNGRWLIAPVEPVRSVARRYRPGTLILETTLETASGSVCLIDFMSRRDGASDLVRIVRGVSGRVAMRTELTVRFDMGSVVPWVSKLDDGRRRFIAGPDRLLLDTPLALRGENLRTVGDFSVAAGAEMPFVLTWTASFEDEPQRLVASQVLAEVDAAWSAWFATTQVTGEWAEAVARSVLTLKALSHWRTGGIVAAGTTSLPEQVGGPRNWDYRYCWLRDATFTLYALMSAGSLEEARAWRQWLIRAVAGDPACLQIMYGVAGERRLDEYEVPWLPGYEASAPVRVGNAASGQLQLDVYGEVMDALYTARTLGLPGSESSWALECALVEHLETIWEQPDDGIWEVRGGRKHFTHSKVMAWVAFDRAVRSAEDFGLEAPLQRWRAVRDRIHAEVCERGFDKTLGAFVQSYGAEALDASLLLIALVGFLPAEDPRVRGTVAAIERGLLRDGFVMRYDTKTGADGLPAGEGAFLACSFWLVDNYALAGRVDEARALFERLIALRNDVGLLAEEYDSKTKRQLGNFPQAFSHLALINSARNLASRQGPAHQRAGDSAATGRP